MVPVAVSDQTSALATPPATSLTQLGPTALATGSAHRVGPSVQVDPTAGPLSAPRQQQVWGEEFSVPLDLSTDTHDGVWRPNDVWQNLNRGYRDFAGSSWNLNPNETPNHNPFTIADGALTITATPTPPELTTTIATSMAAQGQTGTVPTWTGGMLITNPTRHQFLYGYIEIRAKFPTHGAGMFPAIWLYATGDSTNAQNKGGAEIDLFEIFGDPTGQNWHITTHYRNNTNTATAADANIASITTDTTQWHTYAIDWQPTYLRFYLDNTLIGELTGPQATYFNTPMSLRLNYATDAPWFPTNQRTTTGTTGPLTMTIDHIRTYPTKPT